MKKARLTLLVLILLVFALSIPYAKADSTFLDTKYNDAKFTYSSIDIKNPDGTRTATLGIELAYDIDGHWKHIEDAKSLKNSNFVPVIDLDSDYPATVMDFNYTSITLNLSVSDKKLNKDVPIRIEKEDDVFNNKTNKIEKVKTTKQNTTIKFDKKENKIMKIDMNESILDKVIHFGENSTTIIINSTTTGNLGDCWVSSSSPTTNYGTLTDLYVGFASAANERSYIKFNISSIPSNSIIDSSYLGLYDTSLIGNFAVNVSYINVSAANTWSETTLKWNNQPCGQSMYAINPKNCSAAVDSVKGVTGWMLWNVTTAVSTIYNLGWLSISLVIYNITVGSTANYVDAQSKEVTTDIKPYLNITYTPPDTIKPTITNPTVNATSVLQNGNIHLNASVTDNTAMGTVMFYTQPWGNLTTIKNGNEYYINCTSVSVGCNTSVVGTYNFTIVWANDTSNNVNSSAISLQFNVTSPFTAYSVNIVDKSTTSDYNSRNGVSMRTQSDSSSASDYYGTTNIFLRSNISASSISEYIERYYLGNKALIDTMTFSEYINRNAITFRNVSDISTFVDYYKTNNIMFRSATDVSTFINYYKSYYLGIKSSVDTMTFNDYNARSTIIFRTSLDIQTFVDYIIKHQELLKSVSDVSTFIDYYISYYLSIRGVSDTITLSDYINRNVIYFRNVTDLETFSDYYTSYSSILRQNTDIITFKDYYEEYSMFLRSGTEIMTFSDYYTKTSVYFRTATDIQTFLDYVLSIYIPTISANYSANITDIMNMLDSFYKYAGYSKEYLDAITLSDYYTQNSIHFNSIQDIISFTDYYTRFYTGSRTTTDTMIIIDTYEKYADIFKSLSESMRLNDTYDKSIIYFRSPIDIQNFIDYYNSHSELFRTNTDINTIMNYYLTSNEFQRIYASSFNMNDYDIRFVAHFEDVMDLILFIDYYESNAQYIRTNDDAINFIDTFNKLSQSLRTYSSTISMGDYNLKNLISFRNIGDVESFIDYLNKNAWYFRENIDISVIMDNYARYAAYNKFFSDIINFGDGIWGVLACQLGHVCGVYPNVIIGTPINGVPPTGNVIIPQCINQVLILDNGTYKCVSYLENLSLRFNDNVKMALFAGALFFMMLWFFNRRRKDKKGKPNEMKTKQNDYIT